MWEAMLTRLSAALGDSPLLSLGGLLGLAALAYGLYHIRGPLEGLRPPAGPPQQRPDTRGGDPSAPSGPRLAAGAGSSATAAAQPTQQQQAQRPSEAALAAQGLAGAARVTISAPGVLLQERSPEELGESATALARAVQAARAMLPAASVYLLAHVGDDVGEAVVRGALEHAGLVGAGPGKIPPHRLLFCGTLGGKVSVVRQLEPDIHIDAHPATVHELQRFVRRLLLVAPPGSGPPPAGANIEVTRSLAAAFGLEA